MLMRLLASQAGNCIFASTSFTGRNNPSKSPGESPAR